jgi:protein-disulfide isomerase
VNTEIEPQDNLPFAEQPVPARPRRRMQIILLAVVVIRALGAVGVAVATNRPSIPTPTDPESDGPYTGIPRDQTADGMFRLGSPDAPVEVREIFSFGCGHCANFHKTTFQTLLAEDLRGDQINFVMVPFSDPDSMALVYASASAYCAGEQGQFWEMADVLFASLEQYGATAFYPERIQAGVEALGLDAEACETCLSAEGTIAWLNEANNQFATLVQEYPDEVTGTPTLVINGVPPLTSEGHRSGALPIDMLRERIAAAEGS